MSWLDAAHVPSMIIGGVAASVLCRPRLTQDVAALAVLPEADWTEAVRLAPNTRSCLALKTHCTSLSKAAYCSCGIRSPGSTSTSHSASSLFERTAVANCENHDVGGVRVRLPRVEDLLVMKAIARRPKDVQDLEGLLLAHPDVDVASARRWIQEFSIAMGMPDTLDEFDTLVAQLAPKP